MLRSPAFAFAKVVDHAIIPRRANRNDAGMDLSACESVVIPAHGQAIVDTGIALTIPNDCYARVAPRSGLAHKHSLDVMAGVIDCGYTNRIKVILFNHGVNDFEVNPGDRIAQLIFERVYIPETVGVIPYEELINVANENNVGGGFGIGQASTRGLSGFGSTGVSELSEKEHTFITSPVVMK